MKKTKTRQLMTIMFTDIVGYTALMQSDETKAAKLRARHRAVFRGFHAMYHGEIIQYFGDGTLSVFKSAVAAVQCAIDIQRRLQGSDPVPLRIGLHMGDIVFDKTEVYGDAVNVASRIESLASPSSILISAKLNDELKNQSFISTVRLGTRKLKNVTDDIELFAINNEGISVPPSFNGQQENIYKNAIAVLPFTNLSSRDNPGCIGEAIGDGIINSLYKLKNLKVTSRTSSFTYKRSDASLRQIGHELNVAYILQGSIRTYDQVIKISAQLIDAEKDHHVWSDNWSRPIGNMLDIQDEICRLIVDQLATHFQATQLDPAHETTFLTVSQGTFEKSEDHLAWSKPRMII